MLRFLKSLDNWISSGDSHKRTWVLITLVTIFSAGYVEITTPNIPQEALMFFLIPVVFSFKKMLKITTVNENKKQK